MQTLTGFKSCCRRDVGLYWNVYSAKLTNRMNSIENTLHSSTFKIKHTRETKGDAEADDED